MSRQKLSPVEIRILIMVCQGYRGIDIARQTRMASQSVDNAKSRIMKKLKARNMPEAVYKACMAGILE